MCQESNAILCSDGVDNDGDGLIDCEDQECASLINEGCQTCFNDGLSFADFVIEYVQFCGSGNIFQQPEMALGVSDDAGVIGSDRFVSLGNGGWIKLGFSNNRVVNSGDDQPDVFVFEIGPAVESTKVELRPFDNATRNELLLAGVSDIDSDGYFDFGIVTGATSSIDIESTISGFSAGTLLFDAIKLTDAAENGCNSVAPGADIDAVCALSSIPVEICSNQIDDDSDGLTDCDDPDIMMECCCRSTTMLELGAPQFACTGDTIQLHLDENLNSYLWQDGSTEAYIKITNTGIYSVTVVDDMNCMFSDDISITFESDARVTKTIRKCPGETISINGNQVNSPGVFRDTIFDSAHSCDTILEYLVSDWPVQLDFLGVNKTVCGTEYVIRSKWSNTTWPDGSSASTYQIIETGQYVAFARDTNNCEAKDTIQVELINLGNFYFPNAFSPNDDGINDELKPAFPPGNDQNYSLSIYDRWGTKIFEVNGNHTGWDGKIEANQASEGLYVWTLEFSNESCNIKESYQGDVLLLR